MSSTVSGGGVVEQPRWAPFTPEGIDVAAGGVGGAPASSSAGERGMSGEAGKGAEQDGVPGAGVVSGLVRGLPPAPAMRFGIRDSDAGKDDPSSDAGVDKGHVTGGNAACESSGSVGPRWMRFTPADIDRSCCLARTWSKGSGGQCPYKRLSGCDFCKKHSRESKEGGLSHGRVDGDIPEAKFKEFEKVANTSGRRRTQNATGGSASGAVGGESSGRLSRAGFDVAVPSSTSSAVVPEGAEKRGENSDEGSTHEDDVRQVRAAFNSDERLGSELARLLRIVLHSGAEPGLDARLHYARTFRGMVHVHLSQGAYTLGRS